MGLSGLLDVGLDGPDSEATFTPGSFVGPAAGSSKLWIRMSTFAWSVLGGGLWRDWGTALGSGEVALKGHATSDMAGEGRGSQSPGGFSVLLLSEATFSPLPPSLRGVASPGVVAWLVSVSYVMGADTEELHSEEGQQESQEQLELQETWTQHEKPSWSH